MRSFFGQENGQKKPKFITSHDGLEPLKQALLASRDVIIFSEIAARTRRGLFTVGDECWLPTVAVKNQSPIIILVDVSDFVSSSGPGKWSRDARRGVGQLYSK